MLKRTTFAVLALCLAAPACKERTTDTSRANPPAGQEQMAERQTPENAAPATDADRELTQRIREEIGADDSLSTGAHNVAIDARDGSVTLRGQVKTEEEKERVASIAQQIPGVRSVDNQVEVAS